MQKGDTYIFNTHLGVWIGTIVDITPEEVVLDEASWVADTGRFHEFVQEGTYKELEYCGNGIIVPRHCIKIPWRHKLPKKSK